MISNTVNASIVDSSFNIANFGTSSKQSTRGAQFGFNFWSDLSKANRLAVQYSHLSQRDVGAGVGGLTLPERGVDSSFGTHFLAASETYTPNPNTVNIIRGSLRLAHNAIGSTGEPRPSLTVLDAFSGGSSPNDQMANTVRYELYDDVTKKVKRWTLSYGAMIRGQHVSETTRTNFNGSYVFSGKLAPELDANDQPLLDTAGNMIFDQISSIESYRRNLVFRSRGYSPALIRALGGGADQFSIAAGDPDLHLSQVDYAVYEQNSYGLSKTVGVSFGIRYENQTNIRSRWNVAPRFGFIWSPRPRDKQSAISTLPRVTAGVGLFYNRFSITNVLGSLEANAGDRSYFFITDPGVLDAFPSVPSIASLRQFATLQSKRLIDPGFQTPMLRTFNINVAKEIWGKVTTNVSYSVTDAKRQAVTRNINAPLANTLVGNQIPIYPKGIPGNEYETVAAARVRTERLSVNVNFPQYKLWGRTTYISAFFVHTQSHGNDVNGTGLSADPYDFRQEWGPETSDGSNQLSGILKVPLPHGFELTSSWEASNGRRFNIVTGRDTNGDGYYFERPAYASDPHKPGVVSTPWGLLDPNPEPGAAIIPRNLGRGPAHYDDSITLARSWGFHKDKANKNTPKQQLMLTLWVDNVFNFGPRSAPIGNMASPNFLRIVSGYSSDGGFSNAHPRKLHVAVNVSF